MDDERPLTQKLNDDKFLRKLAAKYVKYKDIDWAAYDLGEESGDSIEEAFIDDPKLEKKFDDMVYEHSTKLGYRKLRAGLDEALGKLNELVTDGDEDENNAYRAASKIVEVWTKLDAQRKSREEETDELDEIWKQVAEDESGSKESP